MTQTQTKTKHKHILSFDVEEYFHVELAKRAGIEHTKDFPRRIRIGLEFILKTLSERNIKATFFILAKLAKSERTLIKEIANEGHELACHSMHHKMITQMTQNAFLNDTISSKKLIEDIIGKQIIGYRAPTFSIVPKTLWALDELIKANFAYDSSVYPVKHDIYGIPDAPTIIHKAITPSGQQIYELPLMTRQIGKVNIPVGGGGYFRLFPLSLIANAIRKYEKQKQSAVLYFHPWEFDANQPAMPMPFISKLRHRIGLRRTRAKFKALISQFDFTSADEIIANEKNITTEFNYGTLYKKALI